MYSLACASGYSAHSGAACESDGPSTGPLVAATWSDFDNSSWVYDYKHIQASNGCTAEADASDRPFRLNMQRMDATPRQSVRLWADTPPVVGPGGLGRRRNLRRLPPALQLVSEWRQRPVHTPKPLPLAVPLKPPPPPYVTVHSLTSDIRLVGTAYGCGIASASPMGSLITSQCAPKSASKGRHGGMLRISFDAAMRAYLLSGQHATQHATQRATQRAACNAACNAACSLQRSVQRTA